MAATAKNAIATIIPTFRDHVIDFQDCNDTCRDSEDFLWNFGTYNP